MLNPLVARQESRNISSTHISLRDMWHDYSDIKEVRRLCLIGDDHFIPCFTWTGNAEAKKKKTQFDIQQKSLKSP